MDCLMPERVRLSRARGSRLPENTISVARPTMWGNPYRIGQLWDITEHVRGTTTHRQIVMNNHLAVSLFRSYAQTKPLPVAQLTGKNLACWCPLDQPCHADVLLQLANPDAAPALAASAPTMKDSRP
jgi:hypothetical protein